MTQKDDNTEEDEFVLKPHENGDHVIVRVRNYPESEYGDERLELMEFIEDKAEDLGLDVDAAPARRVG